MHMRSLCYGGHTGYGASGFGHSQNSAVSFHLDSSDVLVAFLRCETLHVRNTVKKAASVQNPLPDRDDLGLLCECDGLLS